MSFQLIWDVDRIEKRYRGFLSRDEFIDAIEKAQSDLRYDKLHFVINDLSQITGHNLSLDDILYGLSLHIGAFLANPRCIALFAVSDPHLRELFDQAIEFIRPSLPDVLCLPGSQAAHAWADAHPRTEPIHPQPRPAWR